ncbi:MAG: DUF4382 domain-containing protein [Thaumarchaeota archaeon]|nr:DUF4382 domain-containing protein [Nitrososphaerota archaeon]
MISKYFLGSKLKTSRRVAGISQTVAALIIIAIIAIAAVGAYGLSLTGRSNTVTQTITSTVSGGTGQTVTITNTITSTVTTTPTGSNGVVSILMSDPPQVPQGVTNVYITYVNMYLHIAGLPDGEGWISVSSSGSIELLGSVNVGQTIASTSIPVNSYNQIRFNVTSAQITFNSLNYSAIVQNGNLTIHLISSLTIDSAQASALIIDVQPFVFNFGSATAPQFVIKPTALSFVVPQTNVTPEMQHLGYKYQIQSNYTWFWQYRHNYLPSINISAASLSSQSLSVSVHSNSSQVTILRAVIVTPIHGGSQSQNISNVTAGYSGFSGSAVFLILQNGTLRQLTQQEYGTGPLNLATAIWGGVGYTLAASQSTTLSYSGLIQLGLRLPPGVP